MMSSWVIIAKTFLGDLSNSNEWNPDIISGVVRPPEQIKLVHDIEAIRSVSSSSTSSGIFCTKCYCFSLLHSHCVLRNSSVIFFFLNFCLVVVSLFLHNELMLKG